MTTAVRGSDGVVGLDGLAGFVDGTSLGRDSVLAQRISFTTVGPDRRVEIVVNFLTTGRFGTTGSGTGTSTGVEESYVGLDDNVGSGKDGDHCQERDKSRDGQSSKVHGVCLFWVTE